MKILYIHQYFKTPDEGGSIRSYYLASGLVSHGYEVEMITSHNKGKYEVREIDGITVRYLPVYYDNKLGFIRRIFAFLQFTYLAIREAKKINGVDLVYAMTTPLTVGLIALRLKSKYDWPYFFEVGDLWPEAPVRMGYIKNRILKSFLYRLEKKIYLKADKIIALSPTIRNYIERVAQGKKVFLIPNMADTDFFIPNRSEKNHLGKFVISYFGAVGRANHLEYLLEAACLCKTHLPHVYFRVMGYGSELERLKTLALKTELNNVEFRPYGSKGEVRELLSESDAVYVSFNSCEVLNTGSPNKFFDSLAAGKLTVINFKGWLKEVLETYQCGFSYDPGFPEEFIEKIQQYSSDQELLRRAQANARIIAERYYSRDLQLKKLLKLLNNEKYLEITDSEVYILTA